MGVSIVDLQVNPRIISATKRGLHDSTAVLNLSGAELERLTGLTSSDITQLKDAVSEAVLGTGTITALEIWRRQCSEETRVPRLSTGCDQLDKALRGGLLTKGITEIVGESASGKTQVCLQLCLCVQLPVKYGGLAGGAMYICTEGAFPNRRLDQMARHFTQRYSRVTKHRFTDQILLEHVADFDGLDQCLQRKLPLALARGKIKLVVVDSVAALFRCHYDNHNLVGRAKHLASLAMQLRRLADQYNVVVICVNQVSANMSKVSDVSSQPRQSIPALGLVWADHVTCRLMMSRRDGYVTMADTFRENETEDRTVDKRMGTESQPVSRKRLEVVFAPHLPPVVFPLVISQSGIAVEMNGLGT
ncbi:DNA repair protein XRCC3-like isoform X2 [Littorina saxatilis]|uniref:DNA repair protein XRCC3-like isoform X2 n=1 Tax=Littorina saxatilis TaxID=31220 RepID=UPI0038B4DD07